MKLKTKDIPGVRWVCALLLLTACCFRTAAVLQGQGLPAPEYESFLLEAGQPYTESGISQDKDLPFLFPDPSYVDIRNRCGAEFDQETLLAQPLTFSLSTEPCVLIIHTHGSEAYRDCPDYRSPDPEKNVLSIGARIADRLNAAGIPTIQDTTLHDVTAGYDRAYGQAAAAIEAYLEQYPTIALVIDVHRDGVPDGAGGQKPLTTTLNGEKVAQLMLVMGSDTPELPHGGWEENLSLAMKVQSYFSALAPGIMRQTDLRGSRYNQHLAPYSLLLEVGSAGNTREEALEAASFVGEHLATLLLAYAS